MVNKTPVIINGWNIDPNNIKGMPPQILNTVLEEHNYYELSKGKIIEKWAVEVKEKYAEITNPKWHKEIELVENVFNKRYETTYTELPPGRARKLEEKRELSTRVWGDTVEIFEIEEGKLYGFEEYTSLFVRNEEGHSQGWPLIDDVRVRDDWFHNFKVEGKPLFIFKAEKVEDHILYRGAKTKLITPRKVTEQEFNELFW